jgi:demethylmenaquinone methyltransferase / 2-methoxy-6-polyprenyl-1,4-benzoquinol methylase
MAQTYFKTGQQRATGVKALFDTVARRYDCINDLQSFGLHRYWKRRLLQLAHPQPGLRALDVCCGTGDIALALAQCGARVVGLDFSAAMLSVAQRRSEQAGLSQVLFLQADALQIPFCDASFDLVTVGYGLRNLASYESGLRELLRVTQPDGRLLLLDFGKPDNALWRCLYFAYLKTIVPLHGRCFCGDAAAYSYILESLKHYPAQHGVADLMRATGWRHIQIHNFLGGIMSIHYGEKAETVC